MRKSAYRDHFAVEDRHWWFRGRWAVVRAMFAHAKPPVSPRILDAGCGTGGNLSRYAQIGEVSGIEPEADAVELCHQRGFERVTQAGIEELPFADAEFDVVAATDVLEHVGREAQALAEMHRVTVPGGAMILTVPAYQWLWSPEDENLHHHRRYTRKRLKKVVERASWKVELATYFNSVLLPPIAAAKLASRWSRTAGGSDLERTPHLLNGPLSLPMRAEAALIRAGVPLPAGVSVGILGRKLG